MNSIGEIYFDKSYFTDEASKTIGEPIIGENAMAILQNRRIAKGRLTLEGQTILSKIIDEIRILFDSDEVKAVWDRKCGCSMCPCYPGYRVKINKEIRSHNKNRFSLWVNQDGSYEFRSPQYTFEIGTDKVQQLEKIFIHEQQDSI